jgi:predicted nucleic acid-binding protein
MRIANPFYLLSDQRLAEIVDNIRRDIAMSRPMTGHTIKALEETARRLRAIRRVTDEAVSADGKHTDTHIGG